MPEAHSALLPFICPSNGAPWVTNGQGTLQELDSAALMHALSKWATCIVDPATTSWAWRAPSGLPNQGQQPQFSSICPRILISNLRIWSTTSQQRDVRAASLIAWCGNVARCKFANDQVVALAKRLGAAKMITPSGRGVVADDKADRIDCLMNVDQAVMLTARCTLGSCGQHNHR
jgi:thiamine pyrophosphate-dependent acetolactate synthase large subunit-like protein